MNGGFSSLPCRPLPALLLHSRGSQHMSRRLWRAQPCKSLVAPWKKLLLACAWHIRLLGKEMQPSARHLQRC